MWKTFGLLAEYILVVAACSVLMGWKACGCGCVCIDDIVQIGGRVLAVVVVKEFVVLVCV